MENHFDKMISKDNLQTWSATNRVKSPEPSCHQHLKTLNNDWELSYQRSHPDIKSVPTNVLCPAVTGLVVIYQKSGSKFSYPSIARTMVENPAEKLMGCKNLLWWPRGHRSIIVIITVHNGNLRGQIWTFLTLKLEVRWVLNNWGI